MNLCQNFFNVNIDCPTITGRPTNYNNVTLLQAASFDYTTGPAPVNSSLRLFGFPVTISNFVTAARYLEITGDASVTLDGTNTNGTITVRGNINLTDNSAGTTVIDKTNRTRPEVAVNINAINASETNFLNLATAGSHYTVSDLILKSVDPGANTITVRLYKLVNGASTVVHSFTIVTGAVALTRGVTVGFAWYCSLDDMFTRPELVGDNIKITVQASAGGPYAITGSYAYRSA
jgi:hypothetical protein